MISQQNRHCTVELQALPSRIGQVRRIISAQLRHWHVEPLIDQAVLGATELLSNVHRHAGSDKQCTVEMDLHPELLMVAVHDHDPRLPELHRAGFLDTCGRGLAIVEAVSESWGMHAEAPGGKVVWFTLSTPRPAAPPHRDTARRHTNGQARGPAAVRVPDKTPARSAVAG